MIIKFKGARPYAKHFPNHDECYKVAPLDFRNILHGNGIGCPILVNKNDFYGSALEHVYQEACHKFGWPKEIIRKWGKEKVQAFGRSEDEREHWYNTLRAEEKIFSSALVDKAQEIAYDVNHPDIVAKLTFGSHSPNWGMKAGDYMSWFDGDVNVAFILDTTTGGMVDISSYLMGGKHPDTWGFGLFYHTEQDIFPQAELPITKDVKHWRTGYGIMFFTLHDFYRDFGKEPIWNFMTSNGFPLAGTEGMYYHLKDVASKFPAKDVYSEKSFENLENWELERIVNHLAPKAHHFQFDAQGTPEFFTYNSRDFLEHFAYIIEDIKWAPNHTPWPNVELLVKNKKFRIVASTYH
ncbi:hypothetical protein KY330_02130 [Candidatus Woesearchaeota archaeon]|nr:hypothetical protein [Candidatus Woesearchaeota archaeon]